MTNPSSTKSLTISDLRCFNGDSIRRKVPAGTLNC
jgi:hypothetical protein